MDVSYEVVLYSMTMFLLNGCIFSISDKTF
jgi:hypothetical protein